MNIKIEAETTFNKTFIIDLLRRTLNKKLGKAVNIKECHIRSNDVRIVYEITDQNYKQNNN